MRRPYLEERIALARRLANETYAAETTPVSRKDFNELMEKIIDALDGLHPTALSECKYCNSIDCEC